MNALERVLACIKGDPIDRVPIFEFMIDPAVVRGILPGASYPDLVDALDIDVVVTPTPSHMYSLQKIGEENSRPVYQSEWGEKRIDTGEMVTIPFEYPLKSREDWKSYQLPDPKKPTRLENLEQLVNRFKGQRAIGCHLHDSFTYPSYLFGMTNLFLNLYDDPSWVKEVVEACTLHSIQMVRNAVEMGADFILFGDDVGGKSGPLMSPEHYREFFLTGLQAVCDEAHKSGAFVVKHTDGNVYSLLDMFLEAGVDAFHPSDPSAGMDIGQVKKRYGARLVVCGGIDTGEPLVTWSVSKLIEVVKKQISELAPGGGWMIASSNTIHSGVKPENYQALVLSTRVYGHYGKLCEPISLELEESIGVVPMKSH
jgi:uroporphyrinogen decarboxylase